MSLPKPFAVSVTHRSHSFIAFTNLYLTCDNCNAGVIGRHINTRCGCGSTITAWNIPCGCEQAGTTSVCPSWGPVNGCSCVERFGKVEHGTPTGPLPEGARL